MWARAPDSEPARLAGGAGGAADARYTGGPVVAAYPGDGWWGTGAVQVVGRAEGRSEFTYCMSLGGEGACGEDDRGSIVVDVLPAGAAPADALLRPADHEWWLQITQPATPGRYGTALWHNYRGYAGLAAKWSVVPARRRYGFWIDRSSVVHRRRVGLADPADTLVLYDAAGGILAEVPCRSVPPCAGMYRWGRRRSWDTSTRPWTPVYTSFAWMPATVLSGSGGVSDSDNRYYYVRFRRATTGALTGDYCYGWGANDRCGARDCVRVPLPGVQDPAAGLSERVEDDDRCETGTITVTVSNTAPPTVPTPANITCAVSDTGATTISWTAVAVAGQLPADRYRIRLDGDNDRILPRPGEADHTATSWSWPTNPPSTVEVAGGNLDGTWSQWSAAFDLAAGCPSTPPP
ncbi:MAG: hypothetical protein OXG72_11385 [Acidobacteria bacterium]|nr:hypothetical protein [Acidobacteriota bacterium]